MNRMAKVAMLLVLLGATKRLSSFNRQKRKRRATQSDLDSDPRAKRRRYVSNSSDDDDLSDLSSLESDMSDDIDLLTESESESSDSFDSLSSSSFDDDEDEEDSLDDLDDDSRNFIATNGVETEDDGNSDPLGFDSAELDSEFEVKDEPVDEISITEEKPDISELKTQQTANVMQLDSNTFNCLFNLPVKEEPEVHFAETTAEEILQDR